MRSVDSVLYNYNGYSGFVSKGYEDDAFVDYLNNIDARVKEVEARHYEKLSGPTDRMVTIVEVPFTGGARRLILKQDDFTRAFNITKTVKYLFKESRGLRAWRASLKLLDALMPVPEPVAYIEKRVAGFFRRGYFFMEYLGGAAILRDRIREGTAREPLIAEAATVIRKLHDLGCTHSDLKSTNFLVRGSSDAAGKVYLIDLEDVRCPGRVSKAARVKGLARFVSSIEGIKEAEVNALLTAYAREVRGSRDSITVDDLRESIKGVRKS